MGSGATLVMVVDGKLCYNGFCSRLQRTTSVILGYSIKLGNGIKMDSNLTMRSGTTVIMVVEITMVLHCVMHYGGL